MNKEDLLCIVDSAVVLLEKMGYVQFVDGTRYKTLLTKATKTI